MPEGSLWSLFPGDVVAAVLAFMPRLFAAIILLLAGLLLAHALRLLSIRLVDALDRLAQRFLRLRFDERRLLRTRSAAVVPRLLYWLTLLLFVGLAAGTLGLEALNRGIESLLGFVPALLVALLILWGGYVLGGIARDAILRSAGAAGLNRADALARIVQGFLVGAAVLVAVSQLGIDVSLIVSVVTVVISATVGAFALGIGLGTPNHVNNYLSARYVRQQFAEGDELQVGQWRGRLLRVDKRGVILDTAEGELHIPAKLFLEQPALKRVSTGPAGDDRS